MKFQSKIRRSNALTGGFLVAAFLFAGSVGALTPNEWRFSQTIDVAEYGLIRVNLPAETLDASRPDLEDVRILDGAGREVPYLIDRPMPRHESAAISGIAHRARTNGNADYADNGNKIAAQRRNLRNAFRRCIH
jgi:hypothetical protein